MKRVFICLFTAAIGFAPAVLAQTDKKAGKQKGVPELVSTQQKKSPATDSGTFNSISSNQAYATPATRPLSIADPTINALRQQAAGNTVLVSPSGIVGMPKRSYGFANGKILLRNTTATSSGTLDGSGAVGTGTTLLGIGAGENALSVNGKSPYAGTSLWGSRLPIRNVTAGDSTRRRE